MNAPGLFPAPANWLAGAHIAIVVSVQDPLRSARVQVQMVAADPDDLAPIWARVAVPYAGNDFGAFLIPGVGDEVLVLFPAGDSSQPIVIGSMWNGKNAVPETLPGNAVDRWTLTGRNGTRIAIIEKANGKETVEISTPKGATATLTDEAGGRIKLKVGSNSITMGSSGIAIKTGSTFSVKAATVTIEASSVDVKTALATFSAAVDCKTLNATAITSTSYSPGAGNVW
jgi:uncharacterized protein involved in type VI secretion and phage assembly